MAENENLVLASSFYNLFVANLVEQHHALDGFLLCDAHIDLVQWNGAIGCVKVVEACLWVDPQKRGNIMIVR